MQVAFLRGGGRTLVTKSHLMGLVPTMAEAHPTARFTTIVRPCTAQLSRWACLTQHACSKRAGLYPRIDRRLPYVYTMCLDYVQNLSHEFFQV